jgi:GAF domain-containing protein
MLFHCVTEISDDLASDRSKGGCSLCSCQSRNNKMNNILPKNEAERLEAIRQYQILDTDPEVAFEDLTQITAQICGTPIALINLFDENRQWFKSKVGLDISQVLRDIDLSPACINKGDVLIIPDTLADEQFATNSVVNPLPISGFTLAHL